ncbi:MAG: hypothetical protein LBI84_05355 [Propionibacteriaceae bacterium]|nr:hypothetical protein [Propionibacteriaceae bacterium]
MTHAGRWAFIVAVAVGGIAWLDTVSVRQLVDEAARYISSGGATWILQAPGKISGAGCEALNSVDGIIAAGALRDHGAPLTLTALPGAPLPAYDATPGLLSLVGAVRPDGSATAAGLALPEAVADAIGIGGSGWVDTVQGVAWAAAVYSWPDDGRRAGLAYAALAAAPATETFDECWLEVWPADQATVNLADTALSASGGQDVPAQLTQLNPRFASSFSADSLYTNRATYWLTPAGALAGLAVGFAAVRSRRLELASALHCGVPRERQTVQTLLETAVWSTAAVLLASPFVLSAGASAAQEPARVAWHGVVCLILGFTGCLFGAAVATLAVREKYLFKIFRTR